MEPILSDTLQQQFLGLSCERLQREWLRRYWALRDPTPTTPENERWEEHLRRVAAARARFGMATAPYYDARGAFFILFGAPVVIDRDLPDSRLGIGYVPKHERWVYPDAGVEVDFAQPAPGLPWVQGTARVHQTNRRDLLNDATNPWHDHDIEDDDLPNLTELAPDARFGEGFTYAPSDATIEAASITEHHVERFALPGPPRPVLPWVFDTDVFPAAPDKPHLEAHVQIDKSQLTFAPGAHAWVAHFGVEGVLLDDSLRVVARAAYRDSIPADSVVADSAVQRSQPCPGQLDFDVAPGAIVWRCVSSICGVMPKRRASRTSRSTRPRNRCGSPTSSSRRASIRCRVAPRRDSPNTTGSCCRIPPRCITRMSS
jgi:GWxTD domain-containing protein